MDVKEIMAEVDKVLGAYSNNLSLEDDFVLQNCKKLTNELEDVLSNYGIRFNYDKLQDMIQTRLFIGNKAHKNRYASDIEYENNQMKRLIYSAVEEKMQDVELNVRLNAHNETVTHPRLNSVDYINDIYYEMMGDLKRQIFLNDQQMWYDVNNSLNKSRETVIEGLKEYREQNKTLLLKSEEVAKKAGVPTLDESKENDDKSTSLSSMFR